MVFPIRPRYIFTTKVIVNSKLVNILRKAPVTRLSIVATTLGLGGDTSIQDNNL